MFRLLFFLPSGPEPRFFLLEHGNYLNLQRTFVTSNQQLHTTLFYFSLFLKIERSHKTIMADATHTHHTHTLLFRTTYFPFSLHSTLLTIHFECVFPRPTGLLHSFSSIPISPLPPDAFRHFLPESGTGSCGTCTIARVTNSDGTFNNYHFWQASCSTCHKHLHLGLLFCVLGLNNINLGRREELLRYFRFCLDNFSESEKYFCTQRPC